MSDFRTYRDSGGGKAIVDLQSDVQPSVVRTVVFKVALVLRPLNGNALNEVVTKIETPSARPTVRPWAITASQAVAPGLVSSIAVKGG